MGAAEYDLDGDRVLFTHTVVVARHRGHGVAAQLVEAALDDVRARHRTAVPVCWYVARFIDERPEYRDLLASASG